MSESLCYVGADPYCIVRCGRSKAVTPVKKNTLNPNFSAKVQFFTSNPGSAEVTVQVSAETRLLPCMTFLIVHAHFTLLTCMLAHTAH